MSWKQASCTNPIQGKTTSLFAPTPPIWSEHVIANYCLITQTAIDNLVAVILRWSNIGGNSGGFLYDITTSAYSPSIAQPWSLLVYLGLFLFLFTCLFNVERPGWQVSQQITANDGRGSLGGQDCPCHDVHHHRKHWFAILTLAVGNLSVARINVMQKIRTLICFWHWLLLVHTFYIYQYMCTMHAYFVSQHTHLKICA